MTDNSNLSRRRFLQATGGAAAAVGLAGCTGNNGGNNDTTTSGGNDTTTKSSSSSGSGNVLNLRNSSISTFDPVANTGTAGGEVITQMFETLLEYPNGEVTVKNLLASDYNVDSTFTKYTFKLKKGVKFHNGDTLTASDVVYSWERLAQSDNSKRVGYILSTVGIKHKEDGDGNYVPNSLAVEAKDDHTLTMEIEKPFHATKEMLAYSSFAIVPKNIVGDIKGADGKLSYKEFSTKNPVGSGPFKLKNWSSNTEAAVERFDGYHGDVAKLDGVHWQIIEDDNARYRTAMNKNLDMFTIPTAHYDPKKLNIKKTDKLGRQYGTYKADNGSTLNVQATPEVATRYIAFNVQQVDKPARQATAYALNAKTICDQMFKGRKNPAHQITPSVIWPGGQQAYEQFAKDNYPYGYNETQLDKAKQVMEDAGYSKDNRYEYTISVYKGGTAYMDAAKLLRDQLASAHIDVKLEQVPFSTMLKRGRNGNLQAWTLGWIMDWPTPDDFTQLLYPPNTNTSKSGPLLYADWRGTKASQKAVDAWKKVQANQSPSDAATKARAAANKEIEKANWEDAVVLNFANDVTQYYKYDWIDMPAVGGAGRSRMKQNHTTKSK